MNSGTKCKGQQTVCHDDGHWSEDEAEMPTGVTDTMLSSPDFVTDNESQHILNVAPGEDNRSMSIFRDTYSEELAYPGYLVYFLDRNDQTIQVDLQKFIIVKFVNLNYQGLTEELQCVWKIFSLKQRNYK